MLSDVHVHACECIGVQSAIDARSVAIATCRLKIRSVVDSCSHTCHMHTEVYTEHKI